MGLPQQTDSSQPTPTQPTPQPPTSRASTLPPEALALATQLFDYARTGATPELAQYLSAGIPPNLTNHKGDTLLMLAAYHGHADTVKMLIEKGADVDVVNERGQSPVAGAVFKGWEGVVRCLVEEGGADVHGGKPTGVETGWMLKRDGCLRIMGIDPVTAERPAHIPDGVGGYGGAAMEGGNPEDCPVGQ